MASGGTTRTGDDPVATEVDRLRAAREAYRDAADAVAEVGEAALSETADALRRAEGLLDRYVDDATGTGDFQAFVTFQGEFAELVEELPDDAPARDAFEAANEIVDQRRLSESDFERAREALTPARDLVGRLEHRETAADDLDDARRAASDRLDELDAEIEELERLRRLGEADLDAPTDRLREPIETYDEAVREAFETFRREAPAREVVGVVADTRHFPLVPFEPPPTDLREYLETAPAGEETLGTLVQYDDYSASKLDHYVEDPGLFRTRVSTSRSYLDRLSPEPLVVGWPPPVAGELRARAGELVSVTAKFAPEDVVARAREVRRLAVRDDYERLRAAAHAESELTAAERERLAAGGVADDLARLREARERLAETLADRIETV
ncbi:hypothetical protein RYH80_10045 [Halobaculum sp. MBLA0147]|uniref:DUF7118 family protein n=1 Tax=Halobaculum sp. MBLA0147 TaxID=3079934 RepID=UPI0035233A89